MVIDASAAIRSLERDAAGLAVRERVAATECHVPHLFDAEVGQTLRRLARIGRVEATVAFAALRALSDLVDHRYPHTGALSARSWALRDNLTFYDGLYVALAAELGMPLLTGDRRLAGAPTLPCAVELTEPI